MTFDRMKAALAPVKLYGDSAEELNAELMAYADELEMIEGVFAALLPERFFATAQDEGLSAYEALLGPVLDNESAEDRGERLRLRASLKKGDFTRGGVERALDSFGLVYDIEELPALSVVNITAYGEYTDAQKSYIRSETRKIIPAHLTVNIDFPS